MFFIAVSHCVMCFCRISLKITYLLTYADGMRQEDYSKDWVMHNGKSDLWFWERKMRMDKRWWWEMMNECGKETEQRSGYGDQQIEQ